MPENHPENPAPMPHLTRADSYGYPRTVWIDNLYEDRHTDVLYWADQEDMDNPDSAYNRSGVMVELNEARIRNLHAQLGKIVAEFDSYPATKTTLS